MNELLKILIEAWGVFVELVRSLGIVLIAVLFLILLSTVLFNSKDEDL